MIGEIFLWNTDRKLWSHSIYHYIEQYTSPLSGDIVLTSFPVCKNCSLSGKQCGAWLQLCSRSFLSESACKSSAALPGGDFAKTSFPINNKTSFYWKQCMIDAWWQLWSQKIFFQKQLVIVICSAPGGDFTVMSFQSTIQSLYKWNDAK